MEMNFPHHDLQRASIKSACDYRSFFAQAIARQGNSATARAMMMGSRDIGNECESAVSFLDQRIHYFAASTTLEKQKVAPHGAFFLLNRGKNDVELKSEQAVYQNASANIKFDGLISELSDHQAIHVGQEN